MQQPHTEQSLHTPIVQKLIDDINAGIYKPGDCLPSENQLAAKYNVHRLTVRQAVNALVEKNLVHKLQGRGTFVSEQKIDYYIKSHTNFTENILNIGYLPCLKILSSQVLIANQVIAELLETNAGNSVTRLEFLRTASPTIKDTNIPPMPPLCISVSYLLSENFPDLTTLIYEADSLYSLLCENYGVQPNRIRTQIGVESASTEDVRLLQIHSNTPVLVTRGQVCDQHNEFIEYTVSRFRGDRMTLEVSC